MPGEYVIVLGCAVPGKVFDAIAKTFPEYAVGAHCRLPTDRLLAMLAGDAPTLQARIEAQLLERPRG